MARAMGMDRRRRVAEQRKVQPLPGWFALAFLVPWLTRGLQIFLPLRGFFTCC
ncbi:MAG: hypothetical protein QOF72_2329 [Blastocatellia bacterium]|nr:hypothetical protein [Blastocatellia bacterium]